MNYSDMHKEAIDFFAGQKNTDLSSVVRGEYSALAKALEGKVGSFLQTSGLSATKYEAGAAMEAMEGLQSSVQRYGVDKIVAWLEDTIKIPAEHLQQATLAVLNVLSRHDNSGNGARWASQTMSAPQNQGVQYQALESIYADEIVQNMQQTSGSMEAFGVDMNTTPADLKTALVLTLLQYYIGVVPRILPTLPTNQPSVIFTKSRRKVMDLAENPEAKYNFIELMRNPGLLYGELREIIPQLANAAAGEVVADGWLAPNMDANILKLGVEYESAGVPKYGHAKINITDTVADNVSVKAIRVTISGGANSTPESYTCEVGTTYARLTRTNNSKDAADRQAVFETVFKIGKGATTDAKTTSALLAGLEDGEGILVRFRVTSTINLKTGKVYTSIIPSIAPYTNGADPSNGLQALFPVQNANDSFPGPAALTADVVAYALDARYTEDNFRKTSKLATIDKQQISYELMQGTNYFVQVSLQDKQQEDATVDLGQLIQLEEDAKQIRIIESTINKIDNALKLTGALNPVDDIGSEYIAGDIVFPATYSATLDVAKLKVLQTGDVTGDVRTRVRTFLGYITTELVRLSLIDKVLTNGAEINFGLITNRRVLDNCLSVAHYHNHLNGGDTQGTNNGVEFRLVLDNGIILNVVTTTFNSFYGQNYADANAVNHKSYDKMILFPIMPNSPDSYLNFGQIYDYGAMSGRYSFSDRGSTVERIFANVRRMLIPTNPQGAIIDVVGIEEIMADAVYAKALTGSTAGNVGF